jgi:hypothetical protein
VRKRIVELARSSFYFLDNTFDGVAFADGFVAEVPAQLEEAGMQTGCAIDGKFRFVDGVFLLELSQKEFL